MSQYISIPLIAWAAVSLIMVLVFLWGFRIKNYGVVDVFWAFNFLIIALIIYYLSEGLWERKALVCALTILWSLRLGTYLSVRVLGHLKEEEGRYKQLRAEWTTPKFFIFFQMQALSNVFLCIPFFIVALNKKETLSAMEYTGAALWLICIAGEGLADWQLKQFKKNPLNKGKVCQAGLWNYSRHPNYFFQLSLWISVLIFSLPSPYGWLAVLCPAAIGYLIFKVTGIPMTEEQALRSKGAAYKEYQRTTSVFIPWLKKN